MKLQKKICVLILPTIMLAACGGGGGGGAPSLVRAPNPTIITPPNSTDTYPSIVQGASFTFDPAAIPTLKVLSTSIMPVDILTGSTSFTTGAAYPGDLNLGQVTSFTATSAGTTYVPGQTPATTVAAWRRMPYSPTLNPTGYSYQTYGGWAVIDNNTGATSEYYFSAGVATNAATLPVSGTATYSGIAEGTFVDATTGDWSDTMSIMNATADFAALSVTFGTTSTVALSRNAPTGTVATSNAGLNMTGTLNYAAGSNTFTGTVATANGMSGNATGKFYGPGIATATATKVAGAPTEIGGTFAVTNPAVGTMLGAFGGK